MSGSELSSSGLAQTEGLFVPPVTAGMGIAERIDRDLSVPGVRRFQERADEVKKKLDQMYEGRGDKLLQESLQTNVISAASSVHGDAKEVVNTSAPKSISEGKDKEAA